VLRDEMEQADRERAMLQTTLCQYALGIQTASEPQVTHRYDGPLETMLCPSVHLCGPHPVICRWVRDHLADQGRTLRKSIDEDTANAFVHVQKTPLNDARDQNQQIAHTALAYADRLDKLILFLQQNRREVFHESPPALSQRAVADSHANRSVAVPFLFRWCVSASSLMPDIPSEMNSYAFLFDLAMTLVTAVYAMLNDAALAQRSSDIITALGGAARTLDRLDEAVRMWQASPGEARNHLPSDLTSAVRAGLRFYVHAELIRVLCGLTFDMTLGAGQHMAMTEMHMFQQVDWADLMRYRDVVPESTLLDLQRMVTTQCREHLASSPATSRANIVTTSIRACATMLYQLQYGLSGIMCCTAVETPFTTLLRLRMHQALSRLYMLYAHDRLRTFIEARGFLATPEEAYEFSRYLLVRPMMQMSVLARRVEQHCEECQYVETVERIYDASTQLHFCRAAVLRILYFRTREEIMAGVRTLQSIVTSHCTRAGNPGRAITE